MSDASSRLGETSSPIIMRGSSRQKKERKNSNSLGGRPILIPDPFVSSGLTKKMHVIAANVRGLIRPAQLIKPARRSTCMASCDWSEGCWNLEP